MNSETEYPTFENLFSQSINAERFSKHRKLIYSSIRKLNSLRTEIKQNIESNSIPEQEIPMALALVGFNIQSLETLNSMSNLNPDLTWLKAWLEYSNGDNKLSMATISSTLDSHSESSFLNCEIYLDMGIEEESSKAIDNYCNLASNTNNQNYLKARLCALQGKRLEALKLHQDVAQDEPDFSRNLFRLAYLLDLYGDDEEAIRTYEKCCDLVPLLAAAAFNLAVLYEDYNNCEDAIRCLDEILEEYPNP